MKSSRSLLLWVLLAWFLIAALAAKSELFAHLPPGGVQVLAAVLTVAFLIAARRSARLRVAVAGLGVRTILAFHLIRFVGAYFLWLHLQGRLPLEFAERAGWGDIAAAAGALVLLLVPEGPGFRWALLGWNLLGAADLVVAVGTAGQLILHRPDSMHEMAHWPLALVPLWAVPLLLLSHLYLLRQGSRRGRYGRPDAATVAAATFKSASGSQTRPE